MCSSYILTVRIFTRDYTVGTGSLDAASLACPGPEEVNHGCGNFIWAINTCPI